MGNDQANRNGIDYPVLTIDFKEYDIQSIVYKELLVLKTMISVSYADIDREYTEALAKGYQQGIYSDPTWFANIKRLRAIRSAQIECLNIEIGSRRRNHDVPEARIFEYWFVEAARKMLHPSGFAVIEDEARKMRKESEK